MIPYNEPTKTIRLASLIINVRYLFASLRRKQFSYVEISIVCDREKDLPNEA